MDEERPSFVLLTRENGPQVMFPVFDMIEHLVRQPDLIIALKKDLGSMRPRDFVVRVDAPQAVQDALIGMETSAFPSKTAGVRTMLVFALHYAVNEAERKIKERKDDQA